MPERTVIRRLGLADFRNYTVARLFFDGRHVVLTGNNGAGKTNILEALSLFSPGRGLRRANYADLPRQGGPGGFTIFAEIDGMEGEVEIMTGIAAGDEGTTRKLRINETQARSIDELGDHCRMLWLTPAMDGLFTGPAADRRRFLDRLVLSIDPAHGRRAADFEKAMRMRNKLLEDGRMDPAWLSGIERQMAGLGVAIQLARAEMTGLIARLADESLADDAFPRADLALTGFLDDAAGHKAADLEERYGAMLAEGRYRDQAAGRTLDGPHRADLLVHHRAKAIAAEHSSTGEQKALLIGLILAHAALTGQMTGFAPVLLLDEIAAHLDPGRRRALFDIIDAIGCQAFMTGTDPSLFEAWGGRASHFTVDHGTVEATRDKA